MLNSFKIWRTAICPNALLLTITPIALGTALALSDGIEHIPTAVLIFITAILLHIATNLFKAHIIFQTQAHTYNISVSQKQLKALKGASILFYLIAMPCAYYVLMRGGTPIAIAALTIMALGFLYTREHFSFPGLKEIFAFLVWGPLTVAGAYYIQSFEMNPAVICAGFAPGLIAVGVITVDNLQDLEEDRQAGKKTLTVVFGRTFGFYMYSISITLAGLMPIIIFGITQDHVHTLTACSICLLAIPNTIKLLTRNDKQTYQQAVHATIVLLMIYSFLFAAGWMS